MISNKTICSFMSQLIAKCLNKRSYQNVYEADLDLHKTFDLPKKVSQDELLLKLSSMALIKYSVLYNSIIIHLTDSGAVYLETRQKQLKNKIWNITFNVITICIALAALIVSICK